MICSNKNFFFIREEFYLDTLNYSLLFLAPFILFLCYETLFHSLRECIIWKSFFLVFALIFFMTITFATTSLIRFLIFLEIRIIPIVYLVIVFSKLEDKISASWSIFFFNILGSRPFIILIAINSKFSLRVLRSLFLDIYLEDSFITILLFLPLLCFKIPIFLSHFWLTKAHVSAAGFCSIILARLSLKLGSFGLLKFIHFFKISSIKILSPRLAWSCIGFLVFTLLILRYIDVKYYVAVSSLLHIRFILPACLITKRVGCFGSLLIIISHGLISPFFFMLITVFYESLNNRSLDINKSVERVRKVLGIILIVCLLLNLGVPPFIIFFRELEIIKFLFSYSYYCVGIFIMFILTRITHFMFFCSKAIYRKKIFLVMEDINYNVLLNFYLLIIRLVLILFLF